MITWVGRVAAKGTNGRPAGPPAGGGVSRYGIALWAECIVYLKNGVTPEGKVFAD